MRAAIAVAAVVLGLGSAGAAQIPRIGLLATAACEKYRNWEALRQGLRELGYVEGRSITLECRGAGGRRERLAELAAELVRRKPDVLVTDGSAATRAAMRATKTIPIVMGTVGDPVGSGFVTNLGRPGGNVTGLTLISAELNAKRFELIRELVPGNPRLAVLAPDNPATRTHLRELEAAAQPLGVVLRVVEARDAASLEPAFATMARERAGAVLVLPDVLFYDQRAGIVAFAARARLPAVYEAREFVEVGGLIAYGPRILDNFHRAATFVDKILKGIKPADLPIEQPTRFELVVNLRTARTLGLAIPESILLRADEVIR